MKHISKILMFFSLVAFFSCDEIEHGPNVTNNTPPNDITNLEFVPTNGGFDISYDLPAGKNVLYVKAIYTNNKGVESEVRASAFNNSLKILGYGDVNEKQVKVVTVNESEISSEGVSFSGIPLTPVVDVVAESVEMRVAFGGIKISWVNETEVPIAIDIYAENEFGELEIVETVYTESLEETYSLRGRDPVEQAFKLVIRDRYENISGTVYPDTPNQKLTPLLETRLDKSLFQQVALDNDDNWENWGAVFENLWDENPSPENWVHTQGDIPRPSILTIDLGVNVKLSRFIMHQRGGTWGFRHANPRTFTAYGSLTLPGQDGNLDDWINLGDFESIKPSGLPVGTLSNEDRQRVLDGDEHEFDDQNLVEIRYVRIAVHTAWGGNNATHIRELTFYGQLTN
ncbi:DUF5000 domain-containing lipoprotein [Flavivirga spongiicola]|uniref:DUF5000 domain-containing lipoprotein n=1 Tax=Flavivirga spongiicola TaxID=421621 RepID=A0ABU7XWR8_9FLAO|nr:DUF5000 domain-containing lipoprotein [Flavivirga sp. MEBiC05379]MDO5980214.1 DUF5000 domain-containing lipoprotein [Flavivirga sp. MEBiC05379]